MKVAFVYPHLYFDDFQEHLADSIGIITYEVGRRLARSADVTVYARRGLSQSASFVHEDVSYRRLFVTFDQVLTLINTFDRLGLRDPGRPFFTSSHYYRSYIRQVAKDLRRQGCDIVHMHTYPQFAEVIRAYNPNTKIVLHLGDHSLIQRERSWLERHLKEIDRIVGVSEFITAAIRERFPEHADRCRAVFNGVDVEAFETGAGQAPDDGKAGRLLYVGRLSPEKGIHVLLEAFETVVARHPEARLTIVGPEAVAPKEFVDPFDSDRRFDAWRSFYLKRSGYLAHLQQALPAHLADHVEFVGQVPYARIREHYQNAAIAVIPSLWHEPFGIPVIEAMAAGMPVVATLGGAFPEIVEHEKTGLLVDRGDATGLADAISRLIADDRLRTAMGSAGRQRARDHFSWDRMTERLKEIYEELHSG